MESINPYKVLELDSKASLDEVKKQYRELSKKYHPDNPTTGDTVKFQELTKAYNMLKDGGYVPEVRKVWMHKSAFTVYMS